ncbi:UbiX family flavin prenyltransferase [Blochmannia endosymbiont of Camponotus sp.]|uniref:UbiX family flavin prenyltransferase n=1 Tax=Blochmannia endosymbiont of Camponotus sp. TaxID=700220 RepID=UPI00202523F3|nr:UbiX family flavin prenyltransferase [Blochmannia endosymbiont of Camponotus sp.]URJ30015.1 UbiX family flavin prenyltransferase [Blochmannia endosymbiont of Camponotus sp.]URJ31092.1 UbiX family flavin prenyltransferase [Blochmannia endosymbiont of Camponotus sp.]
MQQKLRLVVGISGASGGIYGIRALTILKQCNLNVESHLIVTRNALITLQQELQMNKQAIYELADVVHFPQDMGASVASGSYPTLGMLIAPCSIKTMSEISSGMTSSLIGRVADVTLKEKRRLVLMIRETPLHLGHLRTMVKLTEFGAVIMPPVPAYYVHPKTIDDIVGYTVTRALNLFGIDTNISSIWLGIKH